MSKKPKSKRRGKLPPRNLKPLIVEAVNLGVRDCETVGFGLEARLSPETPGIDGAEYLPVLLEPLKVARRSLALRHKSADSALDTALLAPIVAACTVAVSALEQGEEADSSNLRVLLWAALRRYRGLVRRPTWVALIEAWNASQDGREDWQIEKESADIPRITYDYPTAGLEGPKPPSKRGGVNMPIARLRRLIGYQL